MSTTERKLCKNCGYFSPTGECWHDSNLRQDLVTGAWSPKLSAGLLREYGRDCAPQGALFEPPTEAGGVLRVGTLVSKQGGDYRFDGAVVACFEKLSGAVRYVVEDDRGVLHIYSRKNLVVREKGGAA